ncbi:MAG: PAS domain S-box protein [Ferruginibacter sp.]
MAQKIKILHLEDLRSDAELVARELKKGHIDFERLVVTKKKDFEKALKDFSPDIILSDHSLPSFNSIEALRLVKSHGLNVPFILVTATRSEDFAVNVIRQGGDDYVLKSDLGRLPSAINNAIDKRSEQHTADKAARELKSINERMTSHLEKSPLGYIEWDDQLLIKTLSKRAEDIFGWNLREFRINQKLGFNYVYTEDRPRVSEAMDQLLNGTCKTNNIQCRSYTWSGSMIWCEWFNSVLKNEDGKVVMVISLIQDITKTKSIEQDLRKLSEELTDYKYALDEAFSVSVSDDKGVIEYANENFCRLSKYSREELIGQDYRIVNSGYHPGEFMQDLWATISKGHVWKGAFKNKAKDNTYYWVESVIVPFVNENGRAYQYASIWTDITERKQGEESLINNEIRLRHFFETAPESVFVIDAGSGKFVDNNENALSLLKCSREKLLQSSPADFSPPFQPDGSISLEKINGFITGATDGKVRVFEWVLRDSNAMEITCECRLNLLSNTMGPIVRISVIDISEKIRSGKRLVTAEHKKQQQLTSSMMTAQDDNRSFIGEELHNNINQILATSMLYMDLAINADGERKDVMTNSRNYIQLAMTEINKLYISLKTPSLAGMDLPTVLKELLENTRQANNLNFIEDWQELDERVLNEDLNLTIFRIVQEQLTNILKHADAKTVAIGLKSSPGLLQLRIKDDGNGFDCAQQKDGVGLKIIASRADLFHGKVIINSEPGDGCEMLVTFKTGHIKGLQS